MSVLFGSLVDGVVASSEAIRNQRRPRPLRTDPAVVRHLLLRPPDVLGLRKPRAILRGIHECEQTINKFVTNSLGCDLRSVEPLARRMTRTGTRALQVARTVPRGIDRHRPQSRTPTS
eukprot:6448988-Prymnesium_polylepis.1